MSRRLGRPSVLVIIGCLVVVAASLAGTVPLVMLVTVPVLLLGDALVNGERLVDSIDNRGITVAGTTTPWHEIHEVLLHTDGTMTIATGKADGKRRRSSLVADHRSREVLAEHCRFHRVNLRHGVQDDGG